ncbi:DUF4058 family protein [Leptolyngbya sp. AN02str]|uniref:DUF4058 family protein n=1 Tax=Leptolyngbya sp. AN02str TaxID=3423363 RepID=UPI003D31B5A1
MSFSLAGLDVWSVMKLTPTHVSRWDELHTVQSDYRILVSRSNRRPPAQLYVFKVGQEIPQFSVPLAKGDEEPVLELQAVLQQIYKRGRYYLAVNYTQPPQLPLSEADMTWANELLQQVGVRS